MFLTIVYLKGKFVKFSTFERYFKAPSVRPDFCNSLRNFLSEFFDFLVDVVQFVTVLVTKNILPRPRHLDWSEGPQYKEVAKRQYLMVIYVPRILASPYQCCSGKYIFYSVSGNA